MKLEIVIKDFFFEVHLNGERLIGEATPSSDGGYTIVLSRHGKQTGIMTQGEDLMELRNNLVDAIKAYESAKDNLSLSDSVSILKRFNQWRRDGEGEHEHPTKIGIAIDTIINHFENPSEAESVH